MVSIEHDADWYAAVCRRLSGSPRADYRIIQPELNTSQARDPADPDAYVSEDFALSGFEFRKYVTQIDAFPDGYFDLVSIDGRTRPSCIKHSVSKVAPGKLLVLDNAERSYYTAQVQDYLQEFECLKFWGVGPCLEWMWRTDIYVRRK